MSTSLNYAPVIQTPVHLWPLACGAAAITMGAIIDFAFPYTLTFFPWSYRAYEICVLMTLTLNCLMILVGVLLLAAAVPHEGAWIPRWKKTTGISLAGALLLMSVAYWVYVLTTGNLGVSPAEAGYQIVWAGDCICDLLILALLVSAGMYLNMVASHLGRKPLGVIAACALAPCALYTLLDLAWEYMLLFEVGETHPAYVIIVKIISTCFQFHRLWPIVLWGAIALCAGILARQSPAHSSSLPLTPDH